MLGFIRRLFSFRRASADFTEVDWSEAERLARQRLAPCPPALPPATARYALYSTGGGSYDIDDDGELVGYVFRQEGTVWSLTLRGVSYDFDSLAAAKAWLGNPKVRRYS